MPACGAILDLPDPTIDNSIGAGDGSITNDGQVILVDGAFPDGFVPPKDGGGNPDGSPSDSGGPSTTCDGVECFGGGCNTTTMKCEPYPLANVTDPTLIALNGTAGIYVVSGSNEVDKIGFDGTTSAMVSSEKNLVALAANSTAVFFANGGSGSNGFERVTTCPTASCASRKDYVPSGNLNIGGMAVDSTNLYFTVDAPKASGGSVVTCPFTASSCGTTKAPFEGPLLLALEPTSGDLFWDSDLMQGFYACSSSSCSTNAGNNANSGIIDFAVDDTKVWYATMSGVTDVPVPGTSSLPTALPGNDVRSVAIDSTNVYWIDVVASFGTLYTASKTGLAATILASEIDNPGPRSLVVSGHTIFFSARGSTNKVFVLGI